METAVVEAQKTVDVSVMDDASLEQHIAETSKEDEKPAVDENAAAKAEEKKDEAKEKPPVDAAPKEDTVIIRKEEYEKLTKQINDKEQFIQRQANEIGTLRKQAKDKMEQLETEFKNGSVDVVSNPFEATQKMDEYNKTKTAYEDLQRQEYMLQVKAVVSQQAPEFENSLNDIVEALKQDGYAPEVIEKFKANPYLEQPTTLVNLTKRVILQKQMRDYEAKIQALEKKPEEVVKNIEKALKDGKTISASSGQASSVKRSVSEDQIHLMSDSDLDELLKNPD